MDVVKNNSTTILVESTYKGDTHTLSTNEVLDFMKTVTATAVFFLYSCKRKWL